MRQSNFPGQPPSRRGTVGSAIGAVLAFVALVALLVGIPLLLMRYADWPITGVPSGEQIRELPETALSDEALFGLLTVALWAAWALFVCSVVVEIAARLTGRGAARVNVGGPLQRLAARLVGSLLLSIGTLGVPVLGSTPGAMAAPAVPELVGQPAPTQLPQPTPTTPTQAPMPSTSSTAPAQAAQTPDQPSPPSTQPGAPTQPGSPSASVLVQPGDHFWGIAKSTLTEQWGREPSDHEMVGYWLDLVEANRNLLLPPHDPNLIYPQQQFNRPPVPADPVTGQTPTPMPAPTPPPAETPPAPTPPSTETPPETGETTPTTDETGETTPTTEDTGETTPTTEDTGETTPTTEDSGTENDPEDTDQGEEPTNDPDEDGGGGGSGTDAPPAETLDTRSPEQPNTSLDDTSDESGSSFPVLLVAGGVAVAGAVLLLERRRRVQQRYRTRGRRIRMPEQGSSLASAEQSFRQVAEVDRAELVDWAVRAAASRSEAGGLPALRWVEATDETVTLVLGAPVSPPPGFDWEGRDRWVSTATSDELAALANGSGTPAPALVPVGTSRDDVEVLVDLEASGLVEVSGPPRQVEAIMRSLALSAATSPWAEDAKVRLVGLGAELARHDWVTLVPTLSEALDEAEAQVERVSDALRGLRCQTTREARSVSVNPATWAPLVIVSATPPADADEQRRLERLGDRPDHGVAVVVPSVDDRARTGRRITVGDGGWVSVSGVDPEVRPHGMDEGSAGMLADLLDVADDREPVAPTYDEAPARRPPVPVGAGTPSSRIATGFSQGVETSSSSLPEPFDADPPFAPDPVDVPASSADVEPHDDDPLAMPDPLATAAAGTNGGNGGLAALMTEVEVVVRVLGEVEVVRRDRDSWDLARKVDIGRQKAVEAITYLAMRDTAVEREDLEINLFPDGANSTKTVYNIISAARKALGDDLFPVSDGRRYGLSDRVVTDYALFYELTAQADETDDDGAKAELLAESLDLVMAEPFTGAGRGFSWVGPHRGIIVAQVIDAAEDLAELHLEHGDWRAAEWAARKGLRAFPADERMYRILMRTAAKSGNMPGVQRVYRELLQVIADPDDGVEPDDAVHPETLALLEELTGQQRPAS